MATKNIGLVGTALVVIGFIIFTVGHMSGHRHDCQMRGFDRYDSSRQTCAKDKATTEYEIRPPETKEAGR